MENRTAIDNLRPAEQQAYFNNRGFILLAIFLGIALSVCVALHPTWGLLSFGAIGLLVLVCFAPRLGLYLFLILALWEHLAVPVFLLQRVSAAAIVGYFALFGFLYNTLVLKKIRVRRTGQERAFLFLAIAILLSAIGVRSPAELVRQSFTLFQMVILFYLITQLIQNERQLAALLWSVVLFILLSNIISIYQYIMIGQLRVAGIGVNPNYTAGLSLMGIFLTTSLFRRVKAFNLKIFLRIALVVMAAGMILTFSRGVVLAAGTVFLFYILRERKIAKAFSLTLLILVVLLVIAPPEFYQRMSAFRKWRSDPSFRGRYTEASAAIAMIKNKPFFGVGLANYPVNYLRYIAPELVKRRSAHNTYLEIGAELGLLGLGVLLWILWNSWRSFGWVMKNEEKESWLAFTARMTSLGFLGYMVASFFLSAQLQKYFWFLIALGPTLKLLVLRKQDQEPPA